MIIGSAVTLAVLKSIKKLGKKKPNKMVDFKKNTFSLDHNCSDCSAECILRDATSPVIKTNYDLCKKVELKSD